MLAIHRKCAKSAWLIIQHILEHDQKEYYQIEIMKSLDQILSQEKIDQSVMTFFQSPDFDLQDINSKREFCSFEVPVLHANLQKFSDSESGTILLKSNDVMNNLADIVRQVNELTKKESRGKYTLETTIIDFKYYVLAKKILTAHQYENLESVEFTNFELSKIVEKMMGQTENNFKDCDSVQKIVDYQFEQS